VLHYSTLRNTFTTVVSHPRLYPLLVTKICVRFIGATNQESVWYVPLKTWRQLEVDATPLHDWLLNYEAELENALSEPLLASLWSSTEWRTIRFGGDSGQTSDLSAQDEFGLGTWHAHVRGGKRWHICPPSETAFLYPSGPVRDGSYAQLNRPP
jgi:hypothetical protein